MIKADALHTTLKWLLIAFAVYCVLDSWFYRPDEGLIEKDAAQNLAMAYNLRHHGILSTDLDRAPEALRPSRYREPLPVLVLSGYMLALDPIFREQSFQALLQGPNARVLKRSNALWGVLLVGVMILTTRKLGLPVWATALALVLVHVHLDSSFDMLYTEIPATALVALVSYLSLLALQRKRYLDFLKVGLSFGLLILAKASFFYVSIALLLIYIVYALAHADDGQQRRFAFLSAMLILTGTVAIISPWMLRNQLQFGSPNLSDRGGFVLMTRAVKNGMTRDEYIGAFYAYAPETLQPLVGWITGHRPADLEAGGNLERLSRRSHPVTDRAAAEGRIEDIVSYYFRAKAMRAPLLSKFEAEGHPNPLAAADAELQKQAIAMIKAHPRDHAVMTLPFMWRGAPFMFPFFVFVLIYAWRRRDAPLAAYVLPSVGLICFYALLSHFISRYADPSTPISAICLVLLLHRWLEKRRLKRTALACEQR